MSGSLPLRGLRIALTREPQQAAPLQLRLQGLGAEVVLCPLLRFVPPEDPGPLQSALAQVASFHWIIFTSPNGVWHFFQALQQAGGSPQDLLGVRWAAIGPGTARALQEWGWTADLVPAQSQGEGLLEAFAELDLQGVRMLLPRAQQARELLPEGLKARGAQVEVVACYRTLPPEHLPCWQEVDWVVLMSSSAARHLRLVCAEDPPCLCVGPITAATARQVGFTRLQVAQRSDLEGVVEALLEARAKSA